MPDRLMSSLAALGIALAPALLKFAEAPEDSALEADDAADVQCVAELNAPVHTRYKGTGDIEARLEAGAVVQVLSKRTTWRHVAYVSEDQAELGWLKDSYLEDCEEGEPDSEAGGLRARTGGETIKIATFNIQNFGRKKLGSSEVVDELVSIVRKYPLVAVQELSDKTNQVPAAFLDEVNKDGSYEVLVSPRSGKQPDDQTSQEQYAFYYDTAAIEAMSQGELFDDSASDFFVREPYVARFKAKRGTFTFALITIHTKPGVPEEIARLDDVVAWARGVFPGEDDFVVLGDFNAGCLYASPEELDELTIRDRDSYTWIVPDGADTNLAPKACAYDRIVVSAGTRFQGWGIDEAFADKSVSDHWPVWAEFSVQE